MKQSKIILFISIFVLIIQFENSNEAVIGPIIPIIARVLFKNAAKTGMKETAKTGIKETAKTGIKETAKSGVKQTANTGIKGAVKEAAKSPSQGTGQSIKQIVPKETAKVGMKDGAKSSIRNSGQQSIKPPVAVKETAKASMKSGTKESAKSSNRALNVQPVEGTKISSRGVGPSGKPMLHFPKFSSVKKAKEAAKHASHSKGGQPQKHMGKQGKPSESVKKNERKNHYHAVDKKGQEMKAGKYGGVHFQYGKKIG